MTNTNRITGHAAITYAETNGLTLNKYADPTESARDGMTPSDARAVAHEDPGLIWIDIVPPLTVTDDQIRALRRDAGENSDYVQIVMCDRALGDDIDAEDYSGGGHSEREMDRIREIARMTVPEARHACADVINAARAQH